MYNLANKCEQIYLPEHELQKKNVRQYKTNNVSMFRTPAERRRVQGHSSGLIGDEAFRDPDLQERPRPLRETQTS